MRKPYRKIVNKVQLSRSSNNMNKHIRLNSKIKNLRLAFTAMVVIAPLALFVNSIAHKHIAEKNKNFAENQPSIKFLSKVTGKISSEISAAPDVLSSGDETLYKEAFAAIKDKDFNKVDSIVEALDSKALAGAVLAKKYTSSYEPSEKELAAWFEKHSDMPEALDVMRKSKKVNPKLAEEFKVQEKQPALSGYSGSNGLSGKIETAISNKNWKNRSRSEIVWKRVNKLVSEGQLGKAKQIITSAKVQPLFEHVEMDVMRWNISNAYFMQGNDKEALKLSEMAAKRSGENIPGVHWVVGISSYRLGDYSKAADNFESLANAKGVSKWERSAGAFWAYRSFDKKGKDEEAKEMLKIASENPYTFYGILAARAMNNNVDYSFAPDAMESSEIKNIMKFPAVERALAYSEIGMEKNAEKELRRVYLKVSEGEKKQLLKLASLMNMHGLQARMASNLKANDNAGHDYANYPVPHWKPKDGFKVEPALLFALMRLESGFNPNAKSNAGALGLMQLMPETAKYISSKKLDGAVSNEDLLSPETNLTVAQEYVNYLLSNKQIDGNMFFFAAAYNAGPGKFSSWLDEVKFNNDPLLFIESIPVRETRNFIEQVMTNYWIYDKRLDGDNDSIDMVLDGKWPIYTGSIEKTKTYLAQVNTVSEQQ